MRVGELLRARGRACHLILSGLLATARSPQREGCVPCCSTAAAGAGLSWHHCHQQLGPHGTWRDVVH